MITFAWVSIDIYICITMVTDMGEIGFSDGAWSLFCDWLIDNFLAHETFVAPCRFAKLSERIQGKLRVHKEETASE